MWVFVFGPCFVMQYLVSFLVLQSFRGGRKRACCFTLIVFLLLCGCKFSMSLRRSAVVGLWFVIVIFPGHNHLLLMLRMIMLNL